MLRDARIAILRDHGPHVSLDTVARQIGTSRRHLQRVFGELSDHSFQDTLTYVRMAHARRLLREADRSIAEISQAAGYRAPAQFSKAFRRVHGATPRDYRRKVV